MKPESNSWRRNIVNTFELDTQSTVQLSFSYFRGQLPNNCWCIELNLQMNGILVKEAVVNNKFILNTEVRPYSSANAFKQILQKWLFSQPTEF